ncbi:MAG: hypothetical protein ACK5PF_02830, partial [bacterium]
MPDRRGAATRPAGGNGDTLSFPATAGFAYVRLPDPFSGSKVLGQVVRSDGKALLSENVWLSKTRNAQTKVWEYWVNFFDVNTTGQYDSEFQAPPPAALPPVVQFVPDRVVKEAKQVSFIVDASSVGGSAVTLSASPLPAGATFTQQALDPNKPGVRQAVFDWMPPKGSAGSYLITYTAFDGSLSAGRSATIKVEVYTPPPGPGTPAIVAPLSGAQVPVLKPSLSVQASTNELDPTTQVHFEVYADEAETQLVASATVPRAAVRTQPTNWQVPADLSDNKRYWWRARAFDGSLYSPWLNGHFFVNTFNDPPDSFNLTSPTPGAEVASLNPLLSWTNSADKDGDAITYSVAVYKNAGLTELLVEALDLTQGEGDSTSWPLSVALTNHATYYWRVTAKDALGAQTATVARSFVVNTGNTAPTDPVLVSPAVGGQSTMPSTPLIVQNSSDAEA